MGVDQGEPHACMEILSEHATRMLSTKNSSVSYNLSTVCSCMPVQLGYRYKLHVQLGLLHVHKSVADANCEQRVLDDSGRSIARCTLIPSLFSLLLTYVSHSCAAEEGSPQRPAIRQHRGCGKRCNASNRSCYSSSSGRRRYQRSSG